MEAIRRRPVGLADPRAALAAWYENAANVTFLEGHPPDLGPGVRFRWKTFGVTLESKVLEFVPT